jgi:diaminohydroxyphosphoribosylaminopyrimidine deaminase/5-amino-6-(5-phosphoribosylamino)uracil reductase
MTLDGRIAPAPGTRLHRTAGTPASGWITGESSRANVQQQRHQNDAIMVGVGTILADDPLLTDRSGNARRRPLLRVILDSHLRLPLESRLVNSVATKDPSQSDLLVFCSSPHDHKKRAFEARGIRVEQVPPSADGRPDIHAILRLLGRMEIASVMIEGGSDVNATALACGVVDKVFLYYAPKIMASAESVPFISGGLKPMDPALRVNGVTLHRFGEDFAVEGYLRGPYSE